MFELASAQDLLALIPALATVPEASDDLERIDRIRALEELRGALAAAQARETAAFAASRRAEQAARGTGERHVERDIAGQVALARRISPFRARRYVGFAGVLTRELPATFAVLQAGGTSEWRAELVARQTIWLSREHRSEVDLLMAPQLETSGDRRVEAETRRHAYRLDPQGYVDRLAAAETERRVTSRPAPDSMMWLSALLPVAAGVSAYAALLKESTSRRAAGDSRTQGQVMADALVDRILGRAAGEVPVELELVMTDQTLFGQGEAADEPGWLMGYGPLPAGQARELALGGAKGTPRWIRRLFRAPGGGDLVAMESRRRLFTEGQRRFVRLRDQFCRNPWCDAPIRHTDHVRPHEAGGPTSVTNAQGLCEACNQLKQAPGWRSRAHPDGRVDLITPLGRRYGSAPPRAPGPDPGSSVYERRCAVIIESYRHVA